MKTKLLIPSLAALLAITSLQADVLPASEVQTAASQSAMTPEQALQRLKDGNARFVQSLATNRDYLEQVKATATGQHPFAIVLGCVDSRVPLEVVFDQGIGDIFGARVAGNIAPSDIIGSMEFATAAAGSKVILVVGHTACGAVKGAVDGVELGNLTGLLDQIEPAVEQTKAKADGPYTSKNAAFVDAVAHHNVESVMATILKESPVIAEMVEKGEVILAGGMYDLETGKVTFIEGHDHDHEH